MIIYINVIMNHDAKVIRCSNASMYAKIDRLRNIILNTSDDIRMRAHIYPDAAVLTEMTMMGSLSMKCNHYPSKRTDVMTFERPIANKIPSYVEDMSMCMTANSRPIKNVSVRKNPVTAAIISDCVSILEFMDRFENSNAEVGTIVLATYPSVTHAATIAYVFECISAYAKWDGVVNMTVIVDESTQMAMNAYVGPRLNVTLLPSMNQIMCVNEIINTEGYGYMTVITHDSTCARMLLSSTKRMNVDINAVMSINSIETERWIRKTCAKMDMLVEMSPCSDPKMNTVRIVPTHKFGDVSEMTTRFKHMSTPMFGYMRWYAVMVRRMKVDKICYDCSIALKLAYPILYLMSGREMDMTEMEHKDWVEHFSTNVDTKAFLE